MIIDELIKRCNWILRGHDGDCEVSIGTLHDIHNLIREAYELGKRDHRCFKQPVPLEFEGIDLGETGGRLDPFD